MGIIRHIMKIEYTLKEVKPNIFAIIVPDDYDRAMLFCRVQEFYESDNRLYKDQDFDIWDFMRWYSRENNRMFTYTRDWTGFNLPFNTALNCIIGIKDRNPYDIVMQEIIDKILLTENPADAYIIGVKFDRGFTFKHEMCHALYHTNRSYKAKADNTTNNEMSLSIYGTLADNLIQIGYDQSVINDEIQAYMMTNYKSKYFSKNAPMDKLIELHNIYKEQLNQFLR